MLSIEKLRPKRRFLFPRRPHPDLDSFFRRYDRVRLEAGDRAKPDGQNQAIESLPPHRH